MMDKVLCPYCGREMKVEESLPFSGVYAYVCECGAVSPNECGKDEASAAALRRPLQKPLTLKEACGSEEPCVYYESKLNDHLMAVNVIESKSAFFDPHTICEIRWIGSGDVKYILTGDYGYKWRCWATKPTQEELEAAKWE